VLRLVLAAAVPASALAAAVAPAGPAAPSDLLPDLKQDFPGAISLDGGRLSFEAIAYNVGTGPLRVRGTRRGRGDIPADQYVRRSDGSWGVRRAIARFRYARTRTHDHWHLVGFSRYELRPERGGRVVRSRKQGFCLGDREPARERAPVTARQEWNTNCGEGRPDLRTLEEGISPGWADPYPPRLEGQVIDVRGLRPGRYLLTHVADPENRLAESDETNNRASVLIELRRGGVRVLRRVAG